MNTITRGGLDATTRAAVLAVPLVIALISILGCVRSVPNREDRSPEVTVSAGARILVTTQPRPTVPDTEIGIPGMTPVAQNEFLELFFDLETAAFAVRDRGSGRIWRSNPSDPEADPIARGENLDRLRSQLYLTYHTRQGRLQTMSSFKNAVSFGNFDTSPIPRGIRIEYEITTEERIWLIPRVITEERYNEWFRSRLDARAFSRMHYYFNFAERERITNRELFDRYPMLATDNLYIFQDTSRDKDLPLPEFILEDIERTVLSTGYDVHELQRDHTMNAVVGVDIMKPRFRVALEITIDGPHLLLTVPIGAIEHDAVNYPINRINVAEFFGAAGTESDGYILVPDGSGSLIRLNNGKHHLSPYFARIYGPDLAVPEPRQHYRPLQAHLPVFGMMADGASFFAIIESGEAFARVSAHVSQMGTSWNRVFGEFTILPRDELDLSVFGGNNVIQVHQDRLNRGEIRVRYSFLTGGAVGYERMAALYSEYLTRHDGLGRFDAPGSVPFVLETIGAIDRPRPVLGVPVTVTEPLTTFAQTRSIVEQLHERGVETVHLKLTGWPTGGVRHRYPTFIRFERRLGGRSGFHELRSFIESSGGEFFAEISDVVVRPSSFLTGFSPRAHAALRMDRLPAIDARRWLHTNWQTLNLGYSHVVSPAQFPRLYSTIADRYSRAGIPGVALRGAGSAVTSDFRRGETVDRQESVTALVAGLDAMRNAGLSIMASGANAYAATRSAFILDAPMRSNEYYLTDESIPFYQMVFSGSVRYAGAPINLSGDHRRAALDAVATGAALYYRWIYADHSLVKRTAYDDLLSVNYEVWIDEAASLYRRYNDEFGESYGSRLTGFDRPQRGVSVTRFSDGTRVVVNLNDKPVSFDGFEIGPLDFVVDSTGRSRKW